jgi:hypothetical protein
VGDEIKQANDRQGFSENPGGEPACRVLSDSGFEKEDWTSFALTTAIALAVYALTLASNVTLEFSGMLSVGAMYAGVPHPPGYPVWTLYSWVFVKCVPFSNVAWRVACGSAVAASVACGLVALMVSCCGKVILKQTVCISPLKREELTALRLVCGCVAGAALGFGGEVWRDAVVADIWAFGTLLFVVVLCLLIRWAISPYRTRWLYAAFLVFGLLLTDNQELLVVTPALLVFVMLHDRRLGRDTNIVLATLVVLWSALSGWPVVSFSDIRPADNWPAQTAFLALGAASTFLIVRTRGVGSEWKAALACGCSLLTGLAASLYVPIASMTNPPDNWGYPRNVEGFFHVLSRGQYERVHATDGFVPFVRQLWDLMKTSGSEFGWLYLLFAAIPICMVSWMRRDARRLLLSFAGVFICVGPLLLATLNPGLDTQSQQVTEPYLCAMFVVLSVLAGFGMMLFGDMVATRGRTSPA